MKEISIERFQILNTVKKYASVWVFSCYLVLKRVQSIFKTNFHFNLSYFKWLKKDFLGMLRMRSPSLEKLKKFYDENILTKFPTMQIKKKYTYETSEICKTYGSMLYTVLLCSCCHLNFPLKESILF